MAIDVSPQQRLEAFYEQVKGESLRPLWLNPPNPAEPSGQVQPYLWPWQTVRASMLEACEVMPLGEEGADRRVLTMVNPTMPPHSAGPTRTLTAAVQLVKPGEEAPSHRHTMAALRFIIEGDGGYTVVDGEPLTMSPGDFLLTPSWTWHGHAHEGSANMLWLDVLDVPLVRTLDLGFYEEFAEPKQLQPASKPRDEGAHRYGAGSMLPTWQQAPSVPYSPLFSYPFSASRDALYRLTDLPPSPTEGYALTYVNPFTGGPVMPTIGACMHLLVSGQSTTRCRTTANAIFHVAQGSGHSILNGQRFDWQFGDTFCVPSWCWQEHQAAASGDAILFQASDAPALQALALLREESEAQH